MARPGERRLLTSLLPSAPPLDLRILGRTLLHAALVGLAAGLIGAGFFAALEVVQKFLLEDLAGYVPLRAHGETLLAHHDAYHYRWWVLLFLPALGALGSGLVTSMAPETRGGGGDAMIAAFHHGAE
jgi:CIC family chloride channel protein